MTISTYVELQDAVGEFMGRDEFKSSGDQSARTREFISLVDADLNSNSRFNLAFMEGRITDTLTSSDRYIAVPPDLKQVRDFILTGADPDIVLEYIPPTEFSARFSLAATGKPTNYTIIGDEFKVGKTPDSAYAVEVNYYAKISTSGPTSKLDEQKPLSSTNTDNWILLNQPDIYLFGALAVASNFTIAGVDLTRYPPLYERSVVKAIQADMVRMTPRSTRRVRTLGPTP